jgi:polar amino acid transport system substrate-binding protein
MRPILFNAFFSLIFLFMVQTSSSYAADFASLNIMTEEFPPFNYSNKGQPSGRSVELLINASAAVDSPITRNKINIVTWARAYQTALSGPNVMLFSTTRTAQREEFFKWAGPVGQNRTVVWAKKSSRTGKIEDMSTIDKKIVVIRDDVDDQTLVKVNTPSNMIARVSKPDAAAKMLASGRVDLWAYNELTAIEILTRNGENMGDYEIAHVLSSSDLYFAFSKDVDDSVVQLLQKGIDMVKE